MSSLVRFCCRLFESISVRAKITLKELIHNIFRALNSLGIATVQFLNQFSLFLFRIALTPLLPSYLITFSSYLPASSGSFIVKPVQVLDVATVLGECVLEGARSHGEWVREYSGDAMRMYKKENPTLVSVFWSRYLLLLFIIHVLCRHPQQVSHAIPYRQWLRVCQAKG